LKNLKKGDDDLEADIKKKKKNEYDGAPAWHSFKRFLLQVLFPPSPSCPLPPPSVPSLPSSLPPSFLLYFFFHSFYI
jgi:hypothetical protein